MFARLVIASIALLAFGITSNGSAAQEPALPSIPLPKALQPYADIPRVLSAASQVLSLIKTANVSMNPETERPTTCNRDDVLSIYRGMAIAQAGYKIFVNRMELGWTSTERMMDPLGRTFYRALLEPNRLALLSAWRSEHIRRMTDLTHLLIAPPASTRRDLERFISFVQANKEVYFRLRNRAPDKLAEIERISGPLYSALRNEAARPNNSTPDSRFADQWPAHIFYAET